MPQGVYAWSKTAAANSNADSSINWAEGQAPSSVNDSARAVMARIAEYRDDNSGSITTTGTLTAYIAASNQAFASLVLMDKKAIVIVPHVTSGLSPTLNVDGLGAKPMRAATGVALAAGAFIAGTPYRLTYFNTVGEWLCDGAALADGDVTTANLADLSVTAAKIADHTITGQQIAPGSIGTGAIASSFVPVNTCMLNGTIVTTLLGGGAMSVAIKTLAGADPTPGDPVLFMFHNISVGVGNYIVRTVSTALAITLPINQTMGFISGSPGRVWIVAMDVAGVVELALYNATGWAAGLPGTPSLASSINALQAFGVCSTSAIATSLPGNAGAFYSITARTAVPYVPVGYMNWEAGLGVITGASWNVAPVKVQIFQPGSTPLPSAIVQHVLAPSSAIGSGASVNQMTVGAIPTNTQGTEFMSASITPTSSANILLVDAQAHLSHNVTAATYMVMALFQDATVNAVSASLILASETTPLQSCLLSYQAQSTSISTRFAIRACASTSFAGKFNLFNASGVGTAVWPGVISSGMSIREIMG